jgi:hypothetical protein
VYNLDMQRKGRSFNIPSPPGVTVSNVDFHAVEHHNEPYTNAPWTVVVDSAGVTWSTTYNPMGSGNPPPTVPDNPLRWGMLFNFRFDANAPPAATTVTLGLYEPGTPTSVSGITQGPFLSNPALIRSRIQAACKEPIHIHHGSSRGHGVRAATAFRLHLPACTTWTRLTRPARGGLHSV